MAESLIHNRDFIFFGLQPWDIEIGSNFKNMALEIAKNNRVLYVNYPVDRISALRKRNQHRVMNRLESIKTGKNVLVEQVNNLFVLNPPVIVESINWLSFKKVYDRLNYINCKRIATSINQVINQLGVQDSILIIDNDFLRGFYLPELIKHDVFIFYIRDYLLSQPYFKKHGDRLEGAMIHKSDATVCNSLYLAQHAKKYNEQSFDIGQGCDVDLFLIEQHKKPEELRSLDGPVIGYCGALLSTRLDIELLAGIAKSKPEWKLVLIGPEDDAFKSSELHHFKNVFFLGAKSPSQLPEYVHHFDVCLNPQLVNQMTIGNYPRKVDEYLAAGKPVVATKTSTMEAFGDYVYLCKTAEEYVDNIQTALKEKDVTLKYKRQAFAQSHTWKASIGKLYEVIENVSKIQNHVEQ
jgi:teichuronic acid biosynthesis glycosyltransferase TuaH